MPAIQRSILRGCALLAGAILVTAVSTVSADEGRCLIVHVPQDDPKAWKQAINIANNIPKQMGADSVAVEVVAQGPGLNLLTKGSPETDRIKSLAMLSENTLGGGTKFSACAATMAGIKKRTGKEPELLEGVVKVSPGAVARIMELQEQGCTYIRI
jgi:intracellular sulfur oxidation DsrE/DsrF family protein